MPDAEALQRLAEVLEVDVKELLGAPVSMEQKNDEIVEQLARINEQLVIKNRRGRRVWKVVGIVLISIAVLYILLMILTIVAFNAYTFTETQVVEEVEVEVETKEMMNEP